MSKETEQQKKAILTILNPKINLVKINAISGAGKTTTLFNIARAVSKYEHLHGQKFVGRYLAYNKAIADEASQKFGDSVLCSTIHSFAFRHTVKDYELNMGGFFKARDIQSALPYPQRVMIVEAMEQFFLSAYTSFTEFVLHELSFNMTDDMIECAVAHINKMRTGEITCTHDFYLKYFHILLHANIIDLPQVSLLMLDEAGDINPVTLEIFKILKATKKVMVGDNFQNIYSFNNTINGFEKLKNVGELVQLTQSFRVSAEIAKNVEAFCRVFLDEKMEFKGVDYEPDAQRVMESEAYISRTNGTLIGKMIEFDKAGVKYNLTRKVSVLFKVQNIIMNLREGCVIKAPEYKYLEKDVANYYDSVALQRDHKSVFSYIMNLHGDDVTIKSACLLIMDYGHAAIKKAQDNAKRHESDKKTYVRTLTTAHSSKGLEFDAVHILPDLNDMITKFISEKRKILEGKSNRVDIQPDEIANYIRQLPESEKEVLRLYYVAVTRTKFKITNAAYLHL